MSKIRKFIDIGANLTDLMYTGVYNGTKKHEEDLSNVLKRGWNAGLMKLIITGGNLEESTKAIELSKLDDRLFATVGCHPTRCSEFEKEGKPENYLESLQNLIRNNSSKVVAIGECGLDYDRTQFCPKDVQAKYFEMQLQLCESLNLPLFLHCRNAADDLYEILKKFGGIKGVVHSFDGTLEDAIRFIEMGLFIGLNGCSLKTKENLEVVAELPLDKIMIETDCPWCEVRPTHAGYKLIEKDNFINSVKKEKWNSDSMVKSRNEPANIRHVFDIIAATRKEDKDVLESEIYHNTTALFFP